MIKSLKFFQFIGEYRQIAKLYFYNTFDSQPKISMTNIFYETTFTHLADHKAQKTAGAIQFLFQSSKNLR